MGREFILRTVGIAFLAVVLLIPVAMIRDLVSERQARRNEAIADIAFGWGARQTITDPYLAVPYTRRWIEVMTEIVDGKPKERRSEHAEAGVVRIPVDTVNWTLNVTTLEKARGIHKARLYQTRAQVSGRITIPARLLATEANSRYEWARPRIVLGVSDPRGIRSVSALMLGGSRIEFAPGAGDAALMNGVHAMLETDADKSAGTFDFSFTTEIAGSEALDIAPIAKDTTVTLRADWPHPSFHGPFLPARHEIRTDGFDASWKVSQYASQGAERLRTCTASKACAALSQQVLGVALIEPIGVYQKLERASKYGFLFVGLLFVAFFLFELLQRLVIHPIQYLLVGLALAIFFLLITALSEHVSFEVAYAIATAACVGLVTFYVIRVLQGARRGLAFGAGLGLLYGALYLLLKAEDYALLAGSVLMFALLAGVMIATRRIDWYRLTGSRAGQQAPALP